MPSLFPEVFNIITIHTPSVDDGSIDLGSFGNFMIGAPYSLRGVDRGITQFDVETGFTDYYCFYARSEDHNYGASNVILNYYSGYEQEGYISRCRIQLGLGVSPVNGVEPFALNILTAPPGVTFNDPPLTIGILAPGQHKAFWIKRTMLPKISFTSGFFTIGGWV